MAGFGKKLYFQVAPDHISYSECTEAEALEYLIVT